MNMRSISARRTACRRQLPDGRIAHRWSQELRGWISEVSAFAMLRDPHLSTSATISDALVESGADLLKADIPGAGRDQRISIGDADGAARPGRPRSGHEEHEGRLATASGN
jgi:hypothetical protein